MAGFFDAFPGDNQMAARMARFDWESSALGPPERWTPGLRAAVRICLTSRFPMIIWWGPELRFLYNDAYLPLLGTKHPALGLPGRQVWSEIWHIIGPMLDDVLTTGTSTWSEDLLLPMNRHGYWEETYWTYSYSPLLHDDGGVGGVFTAVSDTTERVIGERRLAALNDLGAQGGIARSVDEACTLIAAALGRAQDDIPYAEIHLRTPTGDGLRLAARSPGDDRAPARGWPLDEVMAGGRTVTVSDLLDRFGELPRGGWDAAPAEALVLPLPGEAGTAPVGAIVLAASARRALDEPYEMFLSLVARQCAALVNGAIAYQVQQRRAEELAKLDRAKTAFFSNISHEFRTPLTLMVGPVDELRKRLVDASAPVREDLDVIHRNGLRLGKLVNALLDFSRIEAGRMQARYQPTDLVRFTADLSSAFRAAVEKAGLRFEVRGDPLPEPVYVDREMWEKIVLNLLSNALKFTFDGGIRVEVGRDGDRAAVRIADTGIGIARDELPRLFERFHRVPVARARSHEGSGIGLALVRELVGLHGGAITAESTPDAGTTFTIRLPFGSGHLPAEQLADAEPDRDSETAASFLTEALRWLPGEVVDTQPPALRTDGQELPRVLVADDNADMREYLQRLLSPGYRVRAVPDGAAALSAARADPPDLIVSDVMMPGVDGLELVAAVRRDPRTAGVPVLLLSARAGQEEAIEGLAVGADDYLVKPFSAPELLARVRTNLVLARLRNHHAQWRAALINSLRDGFFVIDEDGTLVEMNDAFADLIGYPTDGLPYSAPYPWWPSRDDPEARRAVEATHERARTTLHDTDVIALRHRDGHQVWVAFTYNTVWNPDGARVLVGTMRDVTAEHDQIQQEAALAAMTSELAEASSFEEVLGVALARLAQLWPGALAVAVWPDGLESVRVKASEGDAGWLDLPDDLRASITQLRENPPLQVRVQPPETALPDGVGTTIDLPGGVVALWLRFVPARRFSTEDRILLALLAGTLGRALRRAQLFDQQREVALALQRAILGPAVLPEGFAVRYEPAVSPLEVGGDWFDVLVLDDDRVGIVVGDCVGRGLVAATVMGQLRSACQALLLRTASPKETLISLDGFAARLDGAVCTTLFCAVLDQRTGLLTYSSAGHPPAILIDVDGGSRRLSGGSGLPLAVAPESRERPETSLTLPPASTLLCYTDGLVERRGDTILHGIDTATQVLREGFTLPTADDQVDHLMRGLRPPDGYEDDVAVLLYRHQPALQLTFAAEVAALGPTRDALREWLHRLSLPATVAQNILVAVGEACANAIEHGHRYASGSIHLSAYLTHSVLTIRVRDRGRWRNPPAQPNTDRGRGLMLMRALVDQVTVTPTRAGTTVELQTRIAP